MKKLPKEKLEALLPDELATKRSQRQLDEYIEIGKAWALGGYEAAKSFAEESQE